MSLGNLSDVEARAVIAYATAALAFAAYHFGSRPAFVERLFGPRDDPERARTTVSWWRRLWGAAWYGLPALALGDAAFPGGAADLYLTAPHGGLAWAATGAALVVLAAVMALGARRPFYPDNYPEVRERAWTAGLTARNALVWAGYLIAYEAFYRGLLLAPLVPLVGPVAAVAIMTVLYALAHLSKNLVETVGALPMGVFYGWVTLESGSILPAFTLHVVTAVFADFLGVRAHPAMRFGPRHPADDPAETP
ncbi:MAG: CPBP family intramembrane metalloprotease [Deltaproteobacteria bacterium]|nr:CPBP family intramembrane metalloprotease [Deltaproteobacteria bacterium]